MIGRSRGIRTPDPLVPNQMRYQAALYSESCDIDHTRMTSAVAEMRIILIPCFFVKHFLLFRPAYSCKARLTPSGF